MTRVEQEDQLPGRQLVRDLEAVGEGEQDQEEDSDGLVVTSVCAGTSLKMLSVVSCTLIVLLL